MSSPEAFIYGVLAGMLITSMLVVAAVFLIDYVGRQQRRREERDREH